MTRIAPASAAREEHRPLPGVRMTVASTAAWSAPARCHRSGFMIAAARLSSDLANPDTR